MIRPLALTCGDPSGIGPEVTLKAWTKLRDDIPFVMLGDVDHLRAQGEDMGVPVTPIDHPDAAMIASGLPVMHLPLAEQPTPGRPQLANAQTTIDSIENAVALTLQGHTSAVVTNPITKKVLSDGAAFPYPGHTEFLAALAQAPRSVMMLAAPELRVVPVTIHIPLSDVPAALTPELIAETARITHAALQRDFGIARPRLAVAGLNPHAGEGGLMGTEEDMMISPTLARLRAEGLDIIGPLPADTMFHAAAREGYDAALCMYHDQALIPLKTLNFAEGVNVTLGLPFIRTSPDHGTAYDIAGKGVAEPDSLIAAIRMAAKMAENRA